MKREIAGQRLAANDVGAAQPSLAVWSGPRCDR